MDKAVTKTLRALEFLCRCQGRVGVTRLAQELTLNKSTAHRILATLVTLGYARRTEDGGYAASLKIGELGVLVSSRDSVGLIAAPHLAELCRIVRETVLIAVLDGHESLYIQKEENSAPGHIGATIGSRLPLYCCATGKILLAFAPDCEERIRSMKFVRYTPHTVTTRSALQKKLAKVRIDGFSVNVEEFNVGVSGLAVPIFNSSGRVSAALAITTLAHRLPQKIVPKTAALMHQTASAISSALGYRGPPHDSDSEDRGVDQDEHP